MSSSAQHPKCAYEEEIRSLMYETDPRLWSNPPTTTQEKEGLLTLFQMQVVSDRRTLDNAAYAIINAQATFLYF